MRNYLVKNNNDPFSFISDAFNDFLRPIFYDEKCESMKTDIKETDSGYEMEVELPGFDKQDIKLSLEEGYLTVRAEKQEKSENKDKYLKRERSIRYERSYYVGDVSEESVKACYNNGVLQLTIPKEEPKKPASKNIAIE